MAEPFAYTVAQLARAWGVSGSTVYGLIERRQLGHLRIGGSIRIRQVDREEYEARAWHAPKQTGQSIDLSSAVVMPAVPREQAPRGAFRKGQKMAAKQR